MRSEWVWYWVTFAATVGVYVCMAVWTLPGITSASGMIPFDLKFLGYDYDYAQRFLAAISPEGMALYLGPQAKLDQIYPALLAVVLSVGIWVMTPLWNWQFRVLAVGLAWGCAAFDYLENAAVAKILLSGGDLTGDMVKIASSYTMAKSALGFIVLTTAFLLVWNVVLSFVQRKLVSK